MSTDNDSNAELLVTRVYNKVVNLIPKTLR